LAWRYKTEQEGLQHFADFMVPHAITRLRQGVGRLLRRPEDAGLVVLGDQRIMKKTYGGRFRKALQPMPLLHSSDEVDAFLERMGMQR
jgi:ATP-dependent DNA helicase DinG